MRFSERCRVDGDAPSRVREAVYRVGPFSTRLQSPIGRLWELLLWCYGETESPAPADLIQYNIRVARGPLHRRLYAPQCRFLLEDGEPFEPFPEDHAFALLEWGMNYAVASRAHQFLMLHAGVVERDGQALILPATPGSGKTTLSAALLLDGWRLLSDEFGLVDYRSGLMRPFPRALPLKNRSIDIIRERAPSDALGPVFEKTRKGDVAHLRPPATSLARQHEPARPAWILFPRFVAGSPLMLKPLSRSVAFTRLSQNAFNYRLLGETGFLQLCALVRHCRCWSAQFSDLDGMVAAINQIPPPE